MTINLQKHLSDKVKVSIHNDSQEEVGKYYAEYIAYTELKGKNKDIELLNETNLLYTGYQMRKARENANGLRGEGK